MKSLRVVMLCGDAESSRIVFNGISSSVEIVKVIVEGSPSASSMIRWRVKRLGILPVFGQLVFIVVNRVLLLTQKPRLNYLRAQFQLDGRPMEGGVVKKVRSINDQEVIDFLIAAQPDAVVVNGTRIIRPSVLSAVNCPFINIHVGITPKYRGVHGGYWAMANSDSENCGVTVHLVDKGVDTGGVLYQARVCPSKDDAFNTYPMLQLAAAIPLMKKALEDVEAGSLKVKEGVGPSRQWFHPTICQYIGSWIFKRVH
jgi:folate-dependent phosphoribosylglycinamide formyltransferase PurN